MKLGNYCVLCIVQKINQNNLQPFTQHYLKMETVFMNTENSKTNEPRKFRLSLEDKLKQKKYFIR